MNEETSVGLGSFITMPYIFCPAPYKSVLTLNVVLCGFVELSWFPSVKVEMVNPCTFYSAVRLMELG